MSEEAESAALVGSLVNMGSTPSDDEEPADDPATPAPTVFKVWEHRDYYETVCSPIRVAAGGRIETDRSDAEEIPTPLEGTIVNIRAIGFYKAEQPSFAIDFEADGVTYRIEVPSSRAKYAYIRLQSIAPDPVETHIHMVERIEVGNDV